MKTIEKFRMSPSVITKKFSHKGYSYVIVKNWLGVYCGYVGITKLTPKYYQNYDLCDEIECHGGITWQGKIPGILKDKSKNGNDFYWVGFDCGHFNDYVPMLDIHPEYRDCVTFRDLDFCIKECKNIIEQIGGRRNGENSNDA